MISSNSTSFPPKFDDYIGTESCYDLENENENNNNVIDVKDKSNAASSSTRKYNCKEKRQFPPPIPFLARTQNLASHMPWVLKRYTTSEGRLILREEKVKRHEYFCAHRENGRLILELVPLDDDVDYYLKRDEEEEEEEEELESPTSSHEEVDVDRFEDEEKFDDEENSKASDNNVDNENGVVVGGGSGRLKCLNYNSMRSSSPSCILIS